MSRNLFVIGAVLLLAAGVWILWPTTEDVGGADAKGTMQTRVQQAPFHEVSINQSDQDEMLRVQAAEASIAEGTSEQAEIIKTVSGRVIMNNVGVPKAKVVVYPMLYVMQWDRTRPVAPLATVDCDSNGEFLVASSVENFCLVPVANDLLAKDTLVISSEAEAEIRGLELELFPAVVLFGEVLADNAPVADATVSARLDEFWARTRPGPEWGVSYREGFVRGVKTNEKGAFSLKVPASLMWLQVRAKGLQGREVWAVNPNTSPIKVELQRPKQSGLFLPGMVIDANGIPVMGATVKALPSDLKAESGRDGSFQLGPFNHNWRHKYAVAAWKSGYAPSVVGVDTKKPDDLVVVTLEQGHVIEGQLVDEEGIGMEDCWIQVDGAQNAVFLNESSVPPTLFEVFPGISLNGLNWVVTKSGGAFSFQDLPQGEYQVTYSSVGLVGAPPSQYEAMASANAGDRNILLQLGEMGGLAVNFVGAVRSSHTGAPLAGAEVRATYQFKDSEEGGWSGKEGGQAICDAQGRFQIHGLKEGFYSFTCRLDGYARSEKEMVYFYPGEHIVDLSMSEARRVDLIVLDAYGERVPSARVEARNADGKRLTISISPSQTSTKAQLNEKGEVALHNLPAEVVTLYVNHHWRYELLSEDVDLRPAGPHRFELRAPVTVPAEFQLVKLSVDVADPKSLLSVENFGNVAEIRAYDKQKRLTDNNRLWRVGNRWGTKKVGNERLAAAGNAEVYLPKEGGSVELEVVGYQSATIEIGSLGSQQRYQKLSVELKPQQ